MTARLPAFILLAGLFLAAAAPAPPGPDALPGQVAGVLGSGDQLSLQLRATADALPRIVHLGEEAIDGWTLSALTDSVATLARDGQTRAIGLNPTGALAIARPAAPPSTVRVNIDGLTPEMAAILALSDEALIAQMPPDQRAWYEATAPERGLTAEEARRLALYDLRFGLMSPFFLDAATAQMKAGGKPLDSISLVGGGAHDKAVLFGQDYVDLVGKQQQYDYQQASDQYQQAVAAGLSLVWVPSGQTLSGYGGAMLEAGYSPQGVLFVIQPPAQPTPIDQPSRPASIPSFTADMLRDLTGLDGSAASSGVQAAALAANQQWLANITAYNARAAATTYYGPFGVVPPPLR